MSTSAVVMWGAHLSIGRVQLAAWRVELLLVAGAEPTATTIEDELSVLHVARHPKLLHHLLQLGLPLEHRCTGDCTPLLQACRDGRLDCVKALLADGADIHATDNHGWGVLHWSVRTRGPCPGRTLLMTAAGLACLEVVKASLAAGADVTAADQQGCTALHGVCGDDASAEQIYTLLMHAGGDLFALDNDSETPLQLAFQRQRCNKGVVQLMNEQAAQVP